MRRLHLPVPDATAPRASDLNAAVGFLEAALSDATARVYIHCRGGRGRTGAVLLAFYARHHSTSCEAALATLQAACPSLSPLPGQIESVRQWLNEATERRSLP